VPKRHAITIFELPEDEYADCYRLVLPLKDLLLPDTRRMDSTSARTAAQQRGSPCGMRTYT